MTAARILIVDDEPNVRLVFRTALEAVGYTVDEVADGGAALDRLRESPADLVLLDLQMPRLDGMATLARLRLEGNEVPVVIITAHGRVPDAVAAMKLGAIDFLAKPLTPASLRNMVAEVVGRHADAAPDPSPREVEGGSMSPFGVSPASLSRAKRALNRRRFSEAEALLGQALRLDPGSAEAHNLMGVLHELREEYGASYREYQAALRADRHYAPAENNMRRHRERSASGSSAVPVDLGESGGRG